MDLISNDWKHLRRTETSQKSFLKTFYYNNKSSKKVKDFQKLSNKTIYLTRQSISTKYNKPFKFILLPKFLEGLHILSPEIWSKTFTDLFEKCSDEYIFSNPAIHRMGNPPNILCPKCKEQEESHPHVIYYCKLSKTILGFISELIHLNYSFNIPFKISLKAITMGVSSHFHDGVQLKILPTFLKVFLSH